MRSMKLAKEGDTSVVYFLDRSIDEDARIMEIGDELLELASTLEAGQDLVLDFRHVSSFSTGTIGQIVQLRNAAERHEVCLRLRHVPREIQEILKEMHLDRVLRVES